MSGERDARPLRPDDAAAARAVVQLSLGGTIYEARAIDVLDAALRGDDQEHVGLFLGTDGVAGAALAVIGRVAGAEDAWRLHWLLGGDPDAVAALGHAASGMAWARGARLIVCELPDDAPFALAREALARIGFAPEGTVPDLVREGTALELWVARAAGDAP